MEIEPAPLRDMLDIKVFILYLMANIGRPLNMTELTDVVIQDGYVNYFDFCDCFNKMLRQGAALQSNHTEEGPDGPYERPYFEVTQQGRGAMEELQGRLSYSMREKALKAAFRYLDFKATGTESHCAVERDENSEHGWFVRYSITRGKSAKLLEGSVYVDDEQLANKMKYIFDMNTQGIYRTTWAMLTGEPGFFS